MIVVLVIGCVMHGAVRTERFRKDGLRFYGSDNLRFFVRHERQLSTVGNVGAIEMATRAPRYLSILHASRRFNTFACKDIVTMGIRERRILQ